MNTSMLCSDFTQSDVSLVLQTSLKYPPVIVLDAAHIVHRIQAIFPEVDVSPFISTLLDDFCDTQIAEMRLRNTITYYLDAISENDLFMPPAQRGYHIDKRVRLVNNLDSAITLEQAALDLLMMINSLQIRIVNRFLIYKFHSLNGDGSINIYKVPCGTFEEFCDEMAR